MARNLHVYPKATLVGDQWLFIVKVGEKATGVTNRFEHVETAGVTAEIPLYLLKICFDMTVDDAVTDQDIDDSLYLDDIKNGPGVETVWGNWRDLAEGIISGLTPGYALPDFFIEWSNKDTKQTRNDARKALVTQRDYYIDPGSVHQHQGDGSNLDE